MSPRRLWRSRTRGIRTLCWALALLMAAALLVPVAASLTGNRLVVVDGGSMQPTYHRGDVLWTRPPTPDDLRVGQIVVAGTPPHLYTHRVVEVDVTGAEPRARLKGDANSALDPSWIRPADLFAIPSVHIAGVPAMVVGALVSPFGIGILAVALVVLLWIAIPQAGTVPRR